MQFLGSLYLGVNADMRPFLNCYYYMVRKSFPFYELKRFQIKGRFNV